MSEHERRGALAQAIVDALFTNGAGEHARRLVLELEYGRDGGGWCEMAVRDRVLALLPVAPVVGEREADHWQGPCARYGAALEEIAWPVDGRDTVASLAAIARRAIGVPAARTPKDRG